MGGGSYLPPKCISDVSESLRTIKNQHMLTKDILIDKTSTSGDRLALTHPYIAGFHLLSTEDMKFLINGNRPNVKKKRYFNLTAELTWICFSSFSSSSQLLNNIHFRNNC